MAETSPRIRVRDATPADVDRMAEIFIAAFGPDPGNRLMYPNGVSASAKDRLRASFFPPKPPADEPGRGPNGEHPKPGQKVVMVAELVSSDQEGSEAASIVAYARWTIHREPREEWDWNYEKPETAETLGEGVNVEVFNKFIRNLKRLGRKHARGDPGITLNTLATDPTRQGLGAGSALVRWGTEFSDREGIPGYLEASPKGYPVYKKLGFEPIDVQDLRIKELWNAPDDEEDWGVNSAVEFAGPLPPGAFRSVIMKRLSRKQLN